MNWVLEADIVSFFDSVDRKQLARCSRNGWPTGRCCG